MLYSSKITLFALRELHLPVLEPVYHALKTMGFNQLGFSAPNFIESTEDQPGEGLSEKSILDLMQKGIPFWGKQPNELALTVTADACYDRVEGWGPIVCVGHGTISKNIFFTNSPNCRRENYASVLCVPGPWYTNCFGEEVHTNIVPTGFPKMDEIFQDFTIFKLKLFSKINWNLTTKTILFAPTYNIELTSFEMLFDQWKLCSSMQILIKLHGATSKVWQDKYRDLAKKHHHLHFVEDGDLVPYMKISDAMVSDHSSAYVEYFTQDKPIVVIDNPLAHQTNFINKTTIEFLVRDSCHRVSDVNDFLPELQRAITKDPLADQRNHWKKQLFTQIDGKNSQRVAQVVKDLLTRKISPVPPFAEALNIYISPSIVNKNILAENILRSEFSHKIYSHKKIDFLPNANLLDENQSPPLPCIILTGEVLYPHNWDRIWNLMRQWNPGPIISAPALPEGEACGVQQLQLLIGKRLNGSPDLIQQFCKIQMLIHLVEIPQLFMEGLTFSKDVSNSLWEECLVNIRKGEPLHAFFKKAKQVQNIKIGAAIGMYSFVPQIPGSAP